MKFTLNQIYEHYRKKCLFKRPNESFPIFCSYISINDNEFLNYDVVIYNNKLGNSGFEQFILSSICLYILDNYEYDDYDIYDSGDRKFDCHRLKYRKFDCHRLKYIVCDKQVVVEFL
jgi:hypothetical protein